jgi:uncharacterized membrane protein
MSENLNDQVIVAYYPTADAADAAAKQLMAWDKADDDIKLGSVGRLVEKENGKLEAKRYGGGRAGRGALIGGALGLVGAAFTGGLSILAGSLAGGAVGGATGALTAGDLGMTDAYLQTVEGKLSAGNAALVVLCDEYEAEPVMQKLTETGGEAYGFGVSKKVLDTIHNKQVQHYEEQQDMDIDKTYMLP